MSNTNTIETFSVPIYHVKDLSGNKHAHEIREKIQEIYEVQMKLPQHPLEVGLADSTSKTEWALGELLYSDVIAPFAALVLSHARLYWDDILNYERGAPLNIAQCWGNIHGKGGLTLEHNHSPIHINAVYYIDVPKGSGALVLRNPLEYTVKQSPLAFPDEVLEHHIEVQSGDLVIMPGWLKHYVPASQSNQPRIVLTFNINGVLERHHRYGLRLCAELQPIEYYCTEQAKDVRASELFRKAESFDLQEIRLRFMKDNKTTPTDTLRIEKELLRFLVLSIIYRDAAFPMGGLPDAYWHALILHTRIYEKLCNSVAGYYIHHQPSMEVRLDSAVVDDRIIMFFQCYEHCFSEAAPLDIWPFSQFKLIHDPS